MSRSFVYIGCFFPRDAVLLHAARIAPRRLDRIIQHPHVTFVYAPEQVDTSLFGLPVQAQVVGYGNDGRNEGFRVLLTARSPALCRLADAIEQPHITLSVAAGGHSVDTGRLTFSPIEPFLLEGRFGGMRPDGAVITGQV